MDLRDTELGRTYGEWEFALFVLLERRVAGAGAMTLKELEGPLGGRAWLSGHEGTCRFNETIITYWYNLSMITCKWLAYCWIEDSLRVGTEKDRCQAIRFGMLKRFRHSATAV